MQRLALLLPLLILPGTGPAAEPVAWPRILMFYGRTLGDERRYITDHQEVMQFMGLLSGPLQHHEAPSTDHPHVNVALYWNNEIWDPYAQDTSRLRDLPLPVTPFAPPPPCCRDNPYFWVQPGRLFLATDSMPPMILIEVTPGNVLRLVTPAALVFLGQRGVPTSE